MWRTSISSHRASPPFGRYQIIVLGDRGDCDQRRYMKVEQLEVASQHIAPSSQHKGGPRPKYVPGASGGWLELLAIQDIVKLSAAKPTKTAAISLKLSRLHSEISDLIRAYLADS